MDLLKKLGPIPAAEPAAKERLNSWKEIAAYLDRTPRTVQRWEAEEDLPVHRLHHDRQSSVYALEDEIDAWWESRRDELAGKNGWAQSVTSLWKKASRKRTPPRRWLWPVVAGVCFILGAAISFLWLRQPAPGPTADRFHIDPPPGTRIVAGGAAVSPDGRHAVFKAGDDRTSAPLWLQSLDSFDARPLRGTEGGMRPFWSPYSSSIGFFADGNLMRIDIAGGSPELVCEAATRGSGIAGAWNRDDVILFGGTDGLHRVAASGGVPELLTVADMSRGERYHGLPQFLPDGRSFLYFIEGSDPNVEGVYAASLDRPEERLRILATDRKAIYTPPVTGRPGYLLWLEERTLVAQPFDAGSLRLEEGPTPLAVDVFRHPVHASAAFWTSDTGLLAYIQSDELSSPSREKLVWLDRDGEKTEEIDVEFEGIGDVALSRDGQSVAFWARKEGEKSDIWWYDLERGVPNQVTAAPASDVRPSWSQDGEWLAFSSRRWSDGDVLLRRADGTGEATVLTETDVPYRYQRLSDWSRDGKYLLYEKENSETGFDLCYLERSDDGDNWQQHPFLREQSNQFLAKLSPNGLYVAYRSDESGQPQVYVQPFPEGYGKRRVSGNSAKGVRWSPDGTELFYVERDTDTLMAVPVSTEGKFWAGTPVPLFQNPHLGPTNWDVSADGQRFLTVETLGGEPIPGRIRAVKNWAADVGGR